MTIKKALAKPNGQIAFLDLNALFYGVKTDEDLNLFLSGLERFQSQQTKLDIGLSDPLMKLLYVLNRTDKALELFMSEVCFSLLEISCMNS
jgi:hypothetical protein